MSEKPKEKPTKEERKTEEWRKALAEGYMPGLWMRRFFRMVPSSPRCGMCLAPFKGVGGIIFKPLPFTSPSRKNPNWCRVCFEEAPIGGAEVPTGVLFADIRGYTSYSESRSPEEVARLLNRFYTVAARVLAGHDAVIDKLVGDEVMALWLPGFAGRDTYITKMVDAAEELLRAVGFGSEAEPWLPLGLGLDHGLAFVGNVGSGEVKDFTALGDVVNTAARLQAQAKPGQIVMSEGVYQEAAAARFPDALMVQLELKGKSEPVAARIVDLNARVAA
jgi:adenylate cyclase